MAPNLSRGLQRLERGGLRAAFIATTVVMLAGIVGFVIWASNPLGPEPEALDALVTDTTVTVTEVDEGWLFVPFGTTPPTGLVLYPGGRVDPRSYAPLARAIAAEGHVVALASMPLNLAVFAPGRASALIDAADGVERWAVGGHSLGGAMAAAYAGSDDERVRGLVLLAAYPAESADLSEHDIAVLAV
ncbi:MAG TPA: alpha/beta fold hydrolase, partial [Coriobacteriia bacterium]|nr:alpha/beta fold hydrolase [Coriobacteriia bacterium]